MRREVLNCFLVTDNDCRTLWHVAVKEGTLEIFLELWGWAIEKLTMTKKIIKN